MKGGEGWRRGTCHVLSCLGHGSLQYLSESSLLWDVMCTCMGFLLCGCALYRCVECYQYGKALEHRQVKNGV